MNIQISLQREDRLVNLLHALYAISDGAAYERNQITFTSDDDLYAFIVRIDINYLAFDKTARIARPERWTENVPFGEVKRRLNLFLQGRYDELRALDWETV